MTRTVCHLCMCPYGENGECACPEALRLADACDAETVATVERDVLMHDTAVELRRLHAENARLREALPQALELLAVATFYGPEQQARRSEVISQGLNLLQQQGKTTGERVQEIYEGVRAHTHPSQRPVQQQGKTP